MAMKNNVKPTSSPEKLNRIKVVATEKGVGQDWIAEKMGISKITVSTWYTNNKQPHLSDLKKLAGILGVDICELLVR